MADMVDMDKNTAAKNKQTEAVSRRI